MSTFESRGGSGSGFERQMSVPNNLSEQGNNHKMNNGFRGFGGGGGNNDNLYGGLFGGRGGNGAGGSPPNSNNGGQRSGFNDMKIGTWNDGPAASSSGQGMQMNGSGNGFPSVGNFEIGTFNISNSSSGNATSSNNASRHNGYNEHHPPGPGHRETGIIEKLLVRPLI